MNPEDVLKEYGTYYIDPKVPPREELKPSETIVSEWENDGHTMYYKDKGKLYRAVYLNGTGWAYCDEFINNYWVRVQERDKDGWHNV